MATYNITVLSSSSSGNGYRFSGTDENGSISSSTSNPTINISAGDTVNFTFSNGSNHPFRIAGTTITGNSANGGYYGNNSTYASYTFSSAMTYAYECTVHGNSMAGSVIASAASTTPANTTTTSTTATPTNTTTTSTTATPSNTTTTSTTATPTNNTTTTQAPTPTNTSTNWKLTSRRLDNFSPPSTLFSIHSDEITSLTVEKIEIETQVVDDTVQDNQPWITPEEDKTLIRRYWDYPELGYVEFTTDDDLPSTVQVPSLEVEMTPVSDLNIFRRSQADIWSTSIDTSSYFGIKWDFKIESQVVRLITNPNDSSELISEPLTKFYEGQLKNSQQPCSKLPDDSVTILGETIDIPPEPYEGGEMNATHVECRMYTDTNNHSSSFEVRAVANSEVSAVASVSRKKFHLWWNVPADTKIVFRTTELDWIGESSPSWKDDVDFLEQNREYNLYGYSFEVKDPRTGLWVKLWEPTDDEPLYNDCEGDPWFYGGKYGPNQNVIRGDDGLPHPAGTQLSVHLEDALREWFGDLLYYYPRDHSSSVEIQLNGYKEPIKFPRTPDYEFRVRAIYLHQKLVTVTEHTFPDGTYARTVRPEQMMFFSKPTAVNKLSTAFTTFGDITNIGDIYRQRMTGFVGQAGIFGERDIVDVPPTSIYPIE
jgi:plastocyanin